MRIKEFSITEYGPLPKINSIEPNGFTLFFGKNEKGKSLIVEALLKMLYSKKSDQKPFNRSGKLDRVEHNPSGYIVLQVDGRDEKYPECGSLSEKHNISSELCRSVFVIQDSDLRIDDEVRFYGTVSDKLLGLNTTTIEQLKVALQEIAESTSTWRLKDDQSSNHLKTRYEEAIGLIDDIEVYLEEATKNGKLEADLSLAQHNAHVDRLKQGISELEKAKKRENYENASKALKRYRAMEGKHKELESVTSEARDAWITANSTLEGKNDGLKKAEALLKEKNDAVIKVEVKEKEASEQESRFSSINTEVKARLQPLVYEYDNAVKNGSVSKSPLVLPIVSVSSGLTVLIATVLSIFIQEFAILAVVALIITWFFVRELRRSSQDTNSPDYKLKQLILEAENFGLEAESAAEIKKFINNSKQDYEKASDEVTRLNERLDAAKQSASEAESTRDDIKNDVKELKDQILGLRKKTGVDEVEDYTKLLDKKHELEGKLSNIATAIRQYLGQNDIEGGPDQWEEKLSQLEKYKNLAPETNFDEAILEENNDHKRKLEEQIVSKRALIGEIRSELAEFDRRSSKCLEGHQEYVQAEFVEDLNSVRHALAEFISKTDDRLKACKLAEQLLDEVKDEQQSKMEDLFDGTAEIFSRITCGEYTGIYFNDDWQKVVVKNKDGSELDADKLSKATYDQLYLSVRIALSEKILSDHTGFFIMDDPFLSSDKERLIEQLNILGDLARKGWQIAYFSAKDEVCNALKQTNCKIIELPVGA